MTRMAGPCRTGKQQFTQDEARARLARIIRESMTGRPRHYHHAETGVYECPGCGWWHLTSQPRNDEIVAPLR